MPTVRLGFRLQFQLQDILAVIIGYGMAALFFRAFWPTTRPSTLMAIAGIGLYVWLGMAMSGPVALLRHEPRPSSGSTAAETGSTPPGTYTWAELAWMLIGSYWIVIELFVIRSRLPEFTAGDMALFGFVPFAAALVSRLLKLKTTENRESAHAWTHKAAVIVLITWPAAWISLIVLGQSLH